MALKNVTGYDFSGWASKNDLLCLDGKIIKKDAFLSQDGMTVPLVYQHNHKEIDNVLGKVILENRDEGVYAYGYLNNTPSGQHARECLIHGDLDSLSIWANNLVQSGRDILHGVIREVSMVLSGANPGAYIESVIVHGEPLDESDTEGILYTNSKIEIAHAATSDDEKEEDKKKKEEKEAMSEEKKDEKKDEQKKDEPTIGEIYDGMTEDQKMVTAAIAAKFVEEATSDKKKKEEEEVGATHSIFDTADQNYLSHDALVAASKQIFADAKRCGSLKYAYDQAIETGVLAHAVPTDGLETATETQTYGINDASMLFPDYHNVTNTPEWISRDMEWVSKVLGAAKRSPFSRIKSMYADITEDDARAKGYIKGNMKKEEFFTTLKRTTSPQTIYKKQKLDRDDILDITDFDVVAWIKEEMKVMLREEQARAILIGDGRTSDDQDKIQELNIRPIASDVDLFTVKAPVTVASGATSAEQAKATINAVIRTRKKYKGSGNPTFFTTEDVVTEMLLIEDEIGHKIYKTEAELATALRVKEIVTVEPMEDQTITVSGSEYPLIGVIVNMNDYIIGADKGAGEELFDDFDIDYNQYKYLIETRMSGALTKPYSAVSVYLNSAVASDDDID